MHATLAFLNVAGARSEASSSADAPFFRLLDLLRIGGPARRAGSARRGRPRSRSAGGARQALDAASQKGAEHEPRTPGAAAPHAPVPTTATTTATMD
jgi:hypothetical protein